MTAPDEPPPWPEEVEASPGNELLDAALSYARRGWAVFPCRPRGKTPLTPHGCKDATTDPATIRAWWARWPNANIAIATGASGLVVVDVDGEAGRASWQALRREYNIPADIPQAKTGKGTHYYFSAPPGLILRPVVGFRPGLDLRAGESYVIAPPSVHPSGARYEWADFLSPADAPPPPLPPGLAALLAERTTPRGKAEPLPDRIPQGQRNAALTSLAGSMRRRGASPEAIAAALLQENRRRCDPPLPEAEVLAIAKGMARYEPEQPDAERDLGHAQVLARLWQDRYRWAAHRGCWMRWTGQRWEPADEAQVAVAAAETLRAEYAARVAAAQDREEVQKWGKRILETCSYTRITGALNFLRGWPGFFTKAGEWDADPWALNVLNGTLDLRTGALRPHNPRDLCTKLASVAFDPLADGSAWQAHVERFLPNASVRRQVQRDLGLSLVGAVLEETLSIWYGVGANGKTTTARVVQRVLGDYARKAAPDLLIASKYERHPTEVADLCGARLAFSVEVDAGKRLAEALVKDLTGGDTKKARFMRQDFFEFEQTFSLVLIVNHKPVVQGTDDGIWRRIRLIPWEYRIPDSEKRPQDEVVAELAGPAVLNWLLAGLKDWQEDHHWVAPEVQAATEAYRAEQDVLGDFLAECCEFGPRYTVGVGELYEAYTGWCSEVGEDPIGKTRFGSLLRQRGLGQKRKPHTRERQWLGLRLRRDEPAGNGGQMGTTFPYNPQEKQKIRGYMETLSPFVPPAAEPASPPRDGLPSTCASCDADDFRCVVCGAEAACYSIEDGRPL
jgi:putative DNA primase/helicase